jgi:hypothetical protein
VRWSISSSQVAAAEEPLPMVTASVVEVAAQEVF